MYLVCTQVNKKNILSRVLQVTSYKINYCLNVALCQHSAYLLVYTLYRTSIKLIDRLKRPIQIISTQFSSLL